MQRIRFAAVIMAAAALVANVAPAGATDLVYTPVNPSFGGSPLNSAHLLGLANAQRDATARDAKKNDTTGGTGTGGTGTSESDVDLFIRQLQGRLLSALASQVTDAIFGQNPQDSGTVRFGGTTVEFERTIDAITLRITDQSGTVTVISVPQLVVTNNNTSTNSALSSSLTSGNLSSSLSTPLN
jgi:curli production assembly/transport component CsgF